MPKFSFASVNGRGLNKSLKRRIIFNKCSNFNISCIQESYITEDKAEEWKRDWKGGFYYSSCTNHSKGLIILTNSEISIDDIELIVKKERIMGLTFKINNIEMTIFNIYAPNEKQQRLKFFEDLNRITSSIDKANLIVCGDFNTVVDNSLDIIDSGLPHDVEVVNKFNDWIINSSLIDSWRLMHYGSKDFTWSRKGNPFRARRLDYIFISENLVSKLMGCEHLIIGVSDHKMVHAFFNTDNFKRGSSFWKFNTSLLKDLDFINEINASIDDFLTNFTDYTDPEDRFEMFKLLAKSKSIDFSTKKNNDSKNREEHINVELKDLNVKCVNNPDDITIHQEIENKKKELELIQMHKTRGSIIRAKAQTIRDGEKNSKLFLNLEKARGNNNTIQAVFDDNTNSTVINQFDIMKHIKNYYANIAKKDDSIKNKVTDINEYLNGINHPILSDEDKQRLSAPLTLDDLGKSLFHLNNESAPGIDGLPVAFYKVFWGKINLLYYDSLMYSIQKGELSTTQKRGVVTLFHKGKELRRDVLKNWRPITLTNTDYKIFSKALASRLQSVLHYLIHINQSGFLKGRSISDHIRTLDDIIVLTDKLDSPGIVISLDFAKAFDSVDIGTILSALRKFNFGTNFIQMVQTLTNNNESCVQNGGWLTGWYGLQRGVKQGCPVSPLLFLLVVEIMAIKIRNNKDITGIALSKNNIRLQIIKILQYCDDTTLLVKDEKELAAAIKDIDEFKIISGLELNKTKSFGMWIGKSKGNTNTPGEISWVKPGELIKILGIYFSSMKEASDIDKNWIYRIEKIKAIMRQWQKRESSVLGKIIICKTFLLSQISYVIQSLSLPEKVLTEIDTLFFKFIWQAKFSEKKAREKVKRAVMCRTIDKGGLEMIKSSDQQKVFLLKWLKSNILEQKETNLKNSNIIDIYFKPFGGLKYMTSFSIKEEDLTFPSYIPRFWRDAIRALLLLKNGEQPPSPVEVKDILQEPLFNNANIKYKKSPLFFKEWINAGITHVYHMVENGNLNTLTQLRPKIGNYGAYIFEYNALWNAIPPLWKEKISSNSVEIDNNINHVNSVNDTILKLNNNNKSIRHLLNNDTSNICGRSFWKNRTDFDIIDNYKIANESTKESRLRVLHFKILHNILPTNIQLKKMGIKNSELCEFCGEREVIEHMLIYCPKLRGFWEMVFNNIFVRTRIRVQRTDAHILFGIRKESLTCNQKQYRIINHIILIAKMCISKARAFNINIVNVIFEAELATREMYLC